jgi:hypothetical protein
LGSIHKDGRERTTSMGKKTSFADGLDIASGPIGDARDNSQTRERSTHDDNDNDKLRMSNSVITNQLLTCKDSWMDAPRNMTYTLLEPVGSLFRS